MYKAIKDFKKITSRIEPWWTIIFVPIWQETVFRFLPYRFIYLSIGRFWEVGIVVSILFALIHWYFGKWFVIYSFFGGLLLWWVMGNFGLLVAILVHALINIVDLKFGIRDHIIERK